MAVWSKALPLTVSCLLITTAPVPILSGAWEKVASDFGFGSGFHCVSSFLHQLVLAKNDSTTILWKK